MTKNNNTGSASLKVKFKEFEVKLTVSESLINKALVLFGFII